MQSRLRMFETTNPRATLSTKICRFLLWIFYFYVIYSGMAAFRVKRYKANNSIVDDDFIIRSITKTTRRLNSRKQHTIYQVYIPKYVLVPYILFRIICCVLITYAFLSLWLVDDFVYSTLVYCHGVTVITCPILMTLIEIWNREKIKTALNTVLGLLQEIEEVNESYSLYQWTHVGFLCLKVFMFSYELTFMLTSFIGIKEWHQFVMVTVEFFILVQMWLNIHVMTLFYILFDVMFRSLNHYLRNGLIMRIRATQGFKKESYTSKQANRSKFNLYKFIELYQRVNSVGLELQSLWQMPLIWTLLSLYLAMLSVVYYLVWQYFVLGNNLTHLIPHVVKMITDIILLSLAAHKAIRSSQLIVNMSLGKTLLAKNADWHLQAESFVYYMKLKEFKLNLMGLFDITNAMALTFVSGIMTAITIFVPFALKTRRLKDLMENIG